MRAVALTERELSLLGDVFRGHREIAAVTLFGSRAEGTHSSASDVDLAVEGELDALQAESIAAELDELPLPYRFEVQALSTIESAPLRDHIQRVGRRIYPLESEEN